MDLLVVMDQGIGNMVMLTPTLRALRELYPEGRIDVWGKYPALEVIEGWEEITSVSDAPTGESYDIGFLTIWSSEMGKKYSRELTMFCKHIYAVPMDTPRLHEVSYHFRIAQLCGYKGSPPSPHVQTTPLDPCLLPPPSSIALSDTCLAHPAWQRKRWPHWNQLARELLRRKITPVIIGGETETQNQIWPDGVMDTRGRFSIPHVASLLKEVRAFVGNDSGPAHISGAVGTKTYVLFGPTRASKNRPLGKDVTVITKGLECSPCQYTPRWEACTKWECMSTLSVQEVLEQVLNEKA